MATFPTLLKEKRLIPVVVRLRSGQFPERKIYAFPECVEWMRREVPKMSTGRIGSHFTPQEQLVERFRQWIAGEPMQYGPWFHDMEPSTDDVWELKTADLRIFGWMYLRRQFIAVRGGYADDYKEPTKTKNYADERREVVKARDALPLDGEKLVRGSFDGLV
jgi:hypothetical protein